MRSLARAAHRQAAARRCLDRRRRGVAGERRRRAAPAGVRAIHDRVHDAALAEEFVDGREFYVGILGTDEPEVLPIVEIDFSGLPAGAPRVLSRRASSTSAPPSTPVRARSSPISPRRCAYEPPRDLARRLSNAARARLRARRSARHRGRRSLRHRGQRQLLPRAVERGSRAMAAPAPTASTTRRWSITSPAWRSSAAAGARARPIVEMVENSP